MCRLGTEGSGSGLWLQELGFGVYDLGLRGGEVLWGCAWSQAPSPAGSAEVFVNDLPGPLKDVEYLQFFIWVGFGKLCWLLWDPGMGFLWMTGL